MAHPLREANRNPLHRYWFACWARRGMLFCSLYVLSIVPIQAGDQSSRVAAAAEHLLRGGNPTWFDEELDRLGGIARQLNMSRAVELLQRWRLPARDDWTLLFLPQPLADEEGTNAAWKSFARAFNGARRRLANEIFAQSAQCADAGEEHAAYRLLWRVLREDPDHEAALAVLGRAARALSTEPRVMSSRGMDPLFSWPPRSFRQVLSPHFSLVSRADVETSRRIAGDLERFHALWLQEFFPLWARAGLLTKCLQEKRELPLARDRFRVYLFADRDEYLAALGAGEEDISVSVGYFNPQRRTSFFYPADHVEETLYHEVTHQLLAGMHGTGEPAGPGVDRDIWIVEGIALYMESLRAVGSAWAVGGVDASRVQTARYRAVRDGYWPQWQAFESAGVDAWKRDPEVARLYAHALGLTHVFIDLLPGDGRRAYFDQLRSVYGKAAPRRRLLDLLGPEEEAARARYQDLLIIDDARLEQLHSARSQPPELVLCGSILQRGSWRKLGELLPRCRWLDVSFTNVEDGDLSWLGKCTELERLSFEATKITAESVHAAAKLGVLKELDLTECQVGDEAIEYLRDHPSLEILWLGQTAVSAASLKTLESIPNLRRCDLNGTRIPPSEIARFEQFLGSRQ